MTRSGLECLHKPVDIRACTNLYQRSDFFPTQAPQDSAWPTHHVSMCVMTKVLPKSFHETSSEKLMLMMNLLSQTTPLLPQAGVLPLPAFFHPCELLHTQTHTHTDNDSYYPSSEMYLPFYPTVHHRSFWDRTLSHRLKMVRCLALPLHQMFIFSTCFLPSSATISIVFLPS